MTGREVKNTDQIKLMIFDEIGSDDELNPRCSSSTTTAQPPSSGQPPSTHRRAICSECPERAVMEFMGWSHSSMAKRYQHVTAVLRNDIASRLYGFLGGPQGLG